MYRCALGCIAFSLLAAAAFLVSSQVDASLSTWLRLVGLSAIGLAALAFIGAAVFRFIETPRQVTVQGPWNWPQDPPVVYLRRED